MLSACHSQPDDARRREAPPESSVVRVAFDNRVWWRSAFSVRGRALAVQQILSCVVIAAATSALAISLDVPLYLPPLAHTVCCGPLGFLLVFRMNQGASRPPSLPYFARLSPLAARTATSGEPAVCSLALT
jgi:hypothetical protein